MPPSCRSPGPLAGADPRQGASARCSKASNARPPLTPHPPRPQHALTFRKKRTHLALLLKERDGTPVPEGEHGEAALAFPNLLPSPALLREVLEELEPLLADKGAAAKGSKSEPKTRK